MFTCPALYRKPRFSHLFTIRFLNRSSDRYQACISFIDFLFQCAHAIADILKYLWECLANPSRTVVVQPQQVVSRNIGHCRSTEFSKRHWRFIRQLNCFSLCFHLNPFVLVNLPLSTLEMWLESELVFKAASFTDSNSCNSIPSKSH